MTDRVLARLPLFSQLNQAQLTQLGASARRSHIARGEFLFHRRTPSHGVYAVITGLMQLSVANADGAEKVLEIIGPGETFGEAVMFLGRPYPVDSIALLPTELLLVPTTAIDALLAQDLTFARSMLASMASRLHTRVNDIEMYTLRSATQRVVAFLAAELGDLVSSDAEQRITLRSTKQVLASRLNLSPETFSRVMRDLADRRLAFVERRQIVVPSPRALASFAD